MSGIAHLAKDNTTRAARIDAMDTDSVNAVIERISGVNPTKLAEGNSSKSPAQESQSAQFGAPPSPITQNFQQQHPAGNSDLHQMQQRMQMLEKKVAMYEGDGTEEADRKVRRAKEAQSNRAGAGDSSGGTYAPNMNTAAAAKKIMKKDQADGEPDGAKAQQPGGQPMAAHKNILGISMNEWNDLIGVTTPYANPSESSPQLAEAREEYEEFVEGYFTEDELAEAWFGFISDKGYDPDDFADFAEAAEEYGDEVALLAIQELEDEFQEVVDTFVEVSESEDEIPLTQEEVDYMMELWLEDRGLSTEVFHFMIDEAVATEDQDELDNLMAVEDLFYEYLDSVLETDSTHSVRMKLRSHDGGQMSPGDMPGAKPSASFLARTRKQGAEQKKKAAPKIMVGRGLKSAAKEEATAAEFQKELGTGQSILTKKDNAPKASSDKPQVPARLLRKQGAAAAAPAKKTGGIGGMIRRVIGKKQESRGFPAWHRIEEDAIQFECDDDGGGGPSIDWERLSKSYDKKQRKGKR